jgi:hypothetical protein
MTEVKTAELLPKMMEILTPLSPEDRRRLITATLTLLGDESANLSGPTSETRHQVSEVPEGMPPRAKLWMNQNSISLDELQQVFQLADGAADVIASDIPGKNDKEKTFSAYILTGISKLLAGGNPAFDDKTARQLCKTSGCFTGGNHATHLSGHGNEFTGSKDKGWVLTAPGLKRGAALVKELNRQHEK